MNSVGQELPRHSRDDAPTAATSVGKTRSGSEVKAGVGLG